ncbi:MAG: tRNA (adenosine(37)-N6)-threonylcarbamoyltransferase complex dimerization subunit type 1 TsaB [Acidimicrobiales bacterium]
MNLLAIETATQACCVGVRTTSGVEIARVVDESRQHTETLSLGMGALIREAGLIPRDIDRVVVDRGPGLFTGLRVGVATANAFAQGLGCSMVGMTSLELLAHGAHDAGVRGTLVSAVDGRRGDVFVQTFELTDTTVGALAGPEVTTSADVVAAWSGERAPVTFTGDGVERYLEDFNRVANAMIYTQLVPSMHAALWLAEFETPRMTIEPLYLREADAVANFATRERPR